MTEIFILNKMGIVSDAQFDEVMVVAGVAILSIPVIAFLVAGIMKCWEFVNARIRKFN